MPGLTQVVVGRLHGDKRLCGVHAKVVLNFVAQGLPRVFGNALEDREHHEGDENDDEGEFVAQF